MRPQHEPKAMRKPGSSPSLLCTASKGQGARTYIQGFGFTTALRVCVYSVDPPDANRGTRKPEAPEHGLGSSWGGRRARATSGDRYFMVIVSGVMLGSDLADCDGGERVSPLARVSRYTMLNVDARCYWQPTG